MYPFLKKGTRIARRQQGCFLLNRVWSVEERVAPGTAVVLSMCCGSMSVEQICEMAGKTLGISEQFCREQLEKFSMVIDMLDTPLEQSHFAYRPSEFVFLPVPYPPDRRGWPDAETGREEKPVELLFALTHKCSFRCIYCFNDSGDRDTELMSTEEWLDIIEQAAEMDIQRITLTGGEPTLHPGFTRIVEKMVSCGIEPDICTNGYQVTQEWVDWLLSLNISYIQISMDSADEDSFNRLVQRDDGFERVTNGIRMLTGAGINVIVKAVMMPDNIKNMPELLLLADDMGVTLFNMERFDSSSCGRGDEGMRVTDTMIEELRDSFKRLREEHPEIKTMSRITQIRECWRNENDIVRCGAFHTNMLIMPNGDVSACEKLIGVPEVTAGNVSKNTLMDIWNSPRTHSIVYPGTAAYEPVCRECEFLKACRAGCYSLKLDKGLPMYSMDPRCFKADKNN